MQTDTAVTFCLFYLVSLLLVLCHFTVIHPKKPKPKLFASNVPLCEATSSSQTPVRSHFVHLLCAAELKPLMSPADTQEDSCVCFGCIIQMLPEHRGLCWLASFLFSFHQHSPCTTSGQFLPRSVSGNQSAALIGGVLSAWLRCRAGWAQLGLHLPESHRAAAAVA